MELQALELVVEPENHLMVAYVRPAKELLDQLNPDLPKRIQIGSITARAWLVPELNKAFVELMTGTIQVWLNLRGLGEFTVAIAVPPEQG